ncbi:MAG: hypothetical protein ACPGOY_01845 [Rhodospirillaceae bacterium]
MTHPTGGDRDQFDWTDRRYYGGDLPTEAEKALHLAGVAWEDSLKAEGHLTDAMTFAPGHLAVHLAHYKFYFYKHRYPEAAPHALACLTIAAERLGINPDWHHVRRQDAPFDGLGDNEAGSEGRLWLFSLTAYGYVLVRAGEIDRGRAALVQAAALDGTGQTGAQRILDSLDRGPDPDDEEDDEDDDGSPNQTQHSRQGTP